MCDDSGNLMAIAQQVINQKQQLEQQQQLLLEQEEKNKQHQQQQQQQQQRQFGTSESTQFDLSPSPSDLSRLLFSDCRKTAHDSPSPPPAKIARVSLPEVAKEIEIADSTHWSSSKLLKSLINCSGIVDSDPDWAAISLIQLRKHVNDRGSPVERLGFYVLNALQSRISSNMMQNLAMVDVSLENFANTYAAFSEACPYSKFAHLTANQEILEATKSASMIHIIDFGIVNGVQWPALLQCFATRSTGKPSRIRISGKIRANPEGEISISFRICIPVPFLGKAPSRFLMATGNRLLEFAKAFDLNIEFEPILTPIQELDHSCFKIDQGDAVVVNFVLQLYNLLDETPIAVERALRLAKALNPTIVTLAEYEVSLNNVDFLDRFKNALTYYKAVFESIDSCFAREAEERLRIEKYLFGQRIACIVGSTITERTEKKEQWKAIMESCGFQKIQISHYSVSQADHLLSNYSPKFSYVERDRAYLSITWGEVEVITVTLWH
ncbi:hypothetical protein GIB67_003189 [Kingdonia uniflora]|uniref:Uncharacterized protein n=1 Tax=Kingdonia uniflora TaxID=39325 RepID=A0A7J7P3S2_9MAGN|nr:hypothetical protein GIB67_003189 [Kingdonia uniflora]